MMVDNIWPCRKSVIDLRKTKNIGRPFCHIGYIGYSKCRGPKTLNVKTITFTVFGSDLVIIIRPFSLENRAYNILYIYIYRRCPPVCPAIGQFVDGHIGQFVDTASSHSSSPFSSIY